jgi:hypothetical protein
MRSNGYEMRDSERKKCKQELKARHDMKKSGRRNRCGKRRPEIMNE